MQDQNIPTTPSRGNYPSLRQPPHLPKDAVSQTIDQVLPDDNENPTLQTLKGLVAHYMRAPHSASDSRTLGPCTRFAMDGVSDATDKDPKLMNAALVRAITNVAMHDGEAGSDPRFVYRDISTGAEVGAPFASSGRAAAQEVLATIVAKRPDLANDTLVKNVTQSATSDPDSQVRLNAQRTLSQIAENRPDLIDADMVKAVRNTAASPIVDHGQSGHGNLAVPMPWVHAGKLSGNQWDRFDNGLFRVCSGKPTERLDGAAWQRTLWRPLLPELF
jgi:hypothetical protein